MLHTNEHYFALTLAVSYLEFSDLVQLLATTKRFKYLRGSVHQLTIDSGITSSSLQNASKFMNLAELTVLRPNRLDINFEKFGKLSTLTLSSVSMCLKTASTINPTQWKQYDGIRSLALCKVFCPTSNILSSFLEQFRGLTNLNIDRCMPLLLGHIGNTIASMRHLETLVLSNCLSDRGKLQLIDLQKLKRLSIENWSNMTGLVVSGTPKLASCSIINCPVSAPTIEHILRANPQLQEVVVNKCSYLGDVVGLEHPTLQYLSVQDCANITELQIMCPRVVDLLVNRCQGLKLLSVCSHRLRSLNVHMLSNLEHIRLQCSSLSSLNLMGCKSLGTKKYRPAYFCDDEGTQTPALVGSLSNALDLLGFDSSTDLADDSHSENSDDSRLRDSIDGPPRVWSRPSSGASPVYSPAKAEEAVTLPAVCLLEQLLEDCPALDWQDFLHNGIGGSGLFDHREELSKKVMEYGVYVAKWGGPTPPNSPPRRKLVGARVTHRTRKPRRAVRKN